MDFCAHTGGLFRDLHQRRIIRVWMRLIRKQRSSATEIAAIHGGSYRDFLLILFANKLPQWKGEQLRAPAFSLQQQPLNAATVRLRDDDPEYNKKASLGSVAFRVVSTNAFIWAVDGLFLIILIRTSDPRAGKTTSKRAGNGISDRLGMNFFFHPFSGAAFFNSARANGYRYFESVPFVFLGSLMWEYFGETTRPAYNDIINTTVSGALFGEILYRLTSNLLDDRTTGAERFFRELGAAVLSPGRAFGRLLQGKLTRVTPKEVYQKEPLNVALATGAHWFNKGTSFGTGSTQRDLQYSSGLWRSVRNPAPEAFRFLQAADGSQLRKKRGEEISGQCHRLRPFIRQDRPFRKPGNADRGLSTLQLLGQQDLRNQRPGLRRRDHREVAVVQELECSNRYSISGSSLSAPAIRPISISWRPGSTAGIMIIPAAAKPSSRGR